MNKQKLIQRLKKLYELAERGEKNEKETAQTMLDALLEKYGISLSEITSDERKTQIYPYTSLWQERIILQIIYKVTERNEIYSCKLGSKKYVEAEVTDYEHIQIKELIPFHFKNYKKERKKILDDLINAYVQKHELYAENTDAEKSNNKIDWEEYIRLKSIMNNLEDVSFYKSIENV